MDTNELAELDEAVAKALGIEKDADTSPEPYPMPYFNAPNYLEGKTYFFRPSTSWNDGGPIIERERINLQYRDGDVWQAHYNGGWACFGSTPLIAAMRAFVASKK